MFSTGRLLRKSTMSLLVPCAVIAALCFIRTIQFGRFDLVVWSDEAGPLGGDGRASGSRAQDSPDGVGQAGGPRSQKIKLGEARPGSLYAVTIWVKDPAQAESKDAVRVTVADASGAVAEKWLHSADVDLYLTLRPRARGPVTATLSAPEGTKLPDIGAAFKPVPTGGARIEPGPAHGAASPPGKKPEADAGEPPEGGRDERAPAVIAA